jgi:hypothetical protein
MYVDAALLFSNAQAVTDAAASESYLDQGAAKYLGTGTPLFVVVVVDATISAYAVTVSLYGDSTTTFTPDASATLGVIPASSAAGTVFVFPVPPDVVKYRYLELYYTPSTSLSAGKFTSFITDTPQAYTAYADNVTIS